jgi:histidinol phosphatase-like enzyme
MIERALADFHCKREDCFVIGDALSDVQAAEAAGCTGILISSKPQAGSGPQTQSFLSAVKQITSAHTVAR